MPRQIYRLYLVTYKADGGTIISQFLRSGKTREGIIEALEKEYNVEYYSLTAEYIYICMVDTIVNKQTI